MLDIKDAKAQSSLVNLANGGDETKSIKGNAFDICILVFILYFLDHLNKGSLISRLSGYLIFSISSRRLSYILYF